MATFTHCLIVSSRATLSATLSMVQAARTLLRCSRRDFPENRSEKPLAVPVSVSSSEGEVPLLKPLATMTRATLMSIHDIEAQTSPSESSQEVNVLELS